jgi:Fe-Mn family superoxide dismutase
MFRLIPSTLLLLLFEATSAASDTFKLPPLPYDYAALEPHISQRTLEIHHGKHHAKYVNTLNSIIKGVSELKGSSLTEIVKDAYGSNQGLFNNAAQSWNHDFYWKCMTPDFEKPPKSLAHAIKKAFGSFEKFKSEFAEAGNTAFGSGWAWLVYDSSTEKLFVTKTIGADNPLALNEKWIPILTMDVWEHAYYLDYHNLRPTYVETFLNKLVNWEFVAENLEAAKTPVEEGEL